MYSDLTFLDSEMFLGDLLESQQEGLCVLGTRLLLGVLAVVFSRNFSLYGLHPPVPGPVNTETRVTENGAYVLSGGPLIFTFSFFS